MSRKSSRDLKLSKRLKRLRSDDPDDEVVKKAKVTDCSFETISRAMSLGDPKPLEEPTVDNSKSSSKLLQKYEVALALYLQDGMSQLSMLVLRRLISEAEVPPPRNKDSLLSILTDAARELQLNEFELVAWAIYLEKFVWNDLGEELETLVLYSAFAVKSYMNIDIAMYQAQLNRHVSNFTLRYNEWISRLRSRMCIQARELNTKFKRLTKPLTVNDNVKVIDYNIYVDEILQISPPYGAVETKSRGEGGYKVPVVTANLELEDRLFNCGQIHKMDSFEDNEVVEFFTRQIGLGNFNLMVPEDRYESGFERYSTISRQNSANSSTHKMTLRRSNSRGENTPNQISRANSFVSSLVNCEYR